MLNRNKYIIKKNIKLKDIFIFRSPDKNIFLSDFVFNFQKFRRRKWKYQRGRRNYFKKVVFTRFAPNLTYVSMYSSFINETLKNQQVIKIDTESQLLSYRSKLFLKKRLGGFFFVKKFKTLRKLFVYKHMITHFNVFDSNYEVLLLRLGFVKSIKEARNYISFGILRINDRIVNQTRHLNNNDLVSCSDNPMIFSLYDSIFNRVFKKYEAYNTTILSKFFDYISLLVKEKEEKFLLGILPFISSINFSNFSFFYFNTLMKNQWHFFIDFFIAKKFLHYKR